MPEQPQANRSRLHSLPRHQQIAAVGLPLRHLHGRFRHGAWLGLGAAANLPQMEQQAVYGTIQRAKPIEDPANAAVRVNALPIYLCPSDSAPPTWFPSTTGDASGQICEVAAGSYVGNYGSDDSDVTGDGVFAATADSPDRRRRRGVRDHACRQALVCGWTDHVGRVRHQGYDHSGIDQAVVLRIEQLPGDVGGERPGRRDQRHVELAFGRGQCRHRDGHIAFLPASLNAAFLTLATRAAGDTPPSGYETIR